MHCKILSGRVVQTAKQVAEVAQACHTIVVTKYVSAGDITHDKVMLKTSKHFLEPKKKHSIIPTKYGKVKASEISTRCIQELVHSFYAKVSQSSQNVSVSSNLQGYSTQPSSPVPVQYQVGQLLGM